MCVSKMGSHPLLSFWKNVAARGVARLEDAKGITLIWVRSVASHLAFVCHLETSWSDSAFQSSQCDGILRRSCPAQLFLCCTECARIFHVSIITSVFSWSAARQTVFCDY